MWLWYPSSASIAWAQLAGPWSAMVLVPHLWPLIASGAGGMPVNRSRGQGVVVGVVLVSSHMTREAFLDALRNEHSPPTGFANSVPGRGHLNRIGHQKVSALLSRYLKTLNL